MNKPVNSRGNIVQRILDGRTGRRLATASAYAPANIALCKYWGKRDNELNLPVTDSLSLALGRLGSRCRLAVADGADAVSLNGEDLPPDHPFSQRLFRFLDAFRLADGPRYRVETVNTIPTAAGFASSASGFASLVLALDALHGWNLGEHHLSILARLGSGSACRSLWQGFVHWHAGTDPDGMDSYAEPLPDAWPELGIGLLVLEGGRKSIGSTEAMRRTVETSALYAAWPAKVAADLEALRHAIAERDFHALGETAESNALAMHATMIAARPPVLYWQGASLDAMQKVWAARRDGLPLYFTMDAGPNLKLLYRETDIAAVEALFPGLIRARQGTEPEPPDSNRHPVPCQCQPCHAPINDSNRRRPTEPPRPPPGITGQSPPERGDNFSVLLAAGAESCLDGTGGSRDKDEQKRNACTENNHLA